MHLLCRAFLEVPSTPDMTGNDQPVMLVVGVGNRDRGDDGFGPAVVQRLRGRAPSTVRILERGGDALALIDDWDGIPSVIVIECNGADQ